MDGVEYEAEAGYLGLSSSAYMGYSSGDAQVAQPFKVGKNITVSGVWVLVGKTGNPTDNMTLSIYSDSAGAPSSQLTNGGATAIPASSISSALQWVYFTFSTPPALSPNTQYWVYLYRSGSVSSSNYYLWSISAAVALPYGSAYYYNGSSWALSGGTATFRVCPVTKSLAATGGQFQGKLTFSEGSPLNHSRGLCNDIKRIYDGHGYLTMRGVLGSVTTAKTFLDMLYGLDHDRINARVEMRLYRQDGTVAIVTGTTNVTGAGPFDVMISARMKGDGADFLKLSVNGASEGTPLTGQTFTMDPLFAQLGAVWLGGGFGPAPAWTQAMTFASLPSAQGWTWTGTATEANAFSASGGKLYQNKNGFGATDTGYYRKTSAGFSNANGAVYAVKLKAVNSCNIFGNSTVNLSIFDGTKQACNCVSGYFVQPYIGDFLKTVQGKFDQECVHVITSKGSDAFLFCNGRLLLDGTGINTISAAGANELWLGDNDGTSGNNSDIVYDYAKYSNTGAILPEFSGMTLHEVAFWSADMTGLAATLYNGGTLKSVKSVCGVRENAVSIVQPRIVSQIGITANQQTNSTTAVPLAEMQMFVLGELFDIGHINSRYSSTAGLVLTSAIKVDGVIKGATSNNQVAANYNSENTSMVLANTPLGLHYISGEFSCNAAYAAVSNLTMRSITVEAK
ncbi:MAG: hypothetical protein HQK56_20590 [Deltaproteobacteria bacterium]|nr:hypothetical protein [Deltaproteobacteria bacterium]